MNKPMVGQNRVSPATQAVLDEASKATTVAEGVRILSPLLKNQVTEIYKNVKFDLQTGKALKAAWKPDQNWDGTLGFEGMGAMLDIDPDCPFMKVLLAKLEPDQALIVDDIVVVHVPGEVDQGYEICPYIHLRKAILVVR